MVASVIVSIQGWIQSPSSPSMNTTFPPPAQAANEPTPIGSINWISGDIATMVSGSLPSAKVIWNGPAQLVKIEVLHAVY